LIYLDEGGDRKVFMSGAEKLMESGAVMSLLSNAVLGLAGANVVIQDARKTIISQFVPYEIDATVASTKYAVSNLPKNVGTVVIYGLSTVVSGSFWLTSCSAGADVMLFLKGDSTGTFGCASTQVCVSCSGCTLHGSVGAAISGFLMHTSVASDCFVHLRALDDNVWAIVAQKGDINE